MRARIIVSPALGLLLLSALWAIASLSSELFPIARGRALSPSLSHAVLFSVFAGVAASLSLARKLKFPCGRLAVACGSVGVGLFVLPSALLSCTQNAVSTLDRVAVFSLTPVFAVVLEPYLQNGHPVRGKAALLGAMVAIAGILLLFPLDVPGSWKAGAALCALIAAAIGIAATNCVAVRLARAAEDGSILPMAAEAGAASALCFAAAGLIQPHPGWHWGALPAELLEPLFIDLPALFLLFWLMRRLAASRMTARFLLAPLLTILAGAALQPPFPPARAWFGMALLGGGAGWLVFAPAERIEGSELNPLSTLIAESSQHSTPD